MSRGQGVRCSYSMPFPASPDLFSIPSLLFSFSSPTPLPPRRAYISVIQTPSLLYPSLPPLLPSSTHLPLSPSSLPSLLSPTSHLIYRRDERHSSLLPSLLFRSPIFTLAALFHQWYHPLTHPLPPSLPPLPPMNQKQLRVTLGKTTCVPTATPTRAPPVYQPSARLKPPLLPLPPVRQGHLLSHRPFPPPLRPPWISALPRL